MRFLIIENIIGDLNILRQGLETLYPDSKVCPEAGRITRKWSDAVKLCQRELGSDGDYVVFLDLSLDDDNPTDAIAGIQRAKADLISQWPQATWIAYTSFSQILEYKEALKLFHGVLNKQEWSTHDKQAEYVRRVVEEATSKRSGIRRSQLLRYEDSPGIRLILYSYPIEVIGELVSDVCRGWDNISLRALSSGYSGATLVSISGIFDSAPRRLIAKLALRKQIIEEEAGVLDLFRGELGEFVGKCARPSPPRQLSQHCGHYSIQEMAPGYGLQEVVVKDNGRNPEAKAAVERVVQIELAQFRHKWLVGGDENQKKLERFELMDIDLHRARQSIGSLEKMAHWLHRNRMWPISVAIPEDIFGEIDRSINDWNNIVGGTRKLYWVLQHGDLNPRNVFIGEGGQITFIDLPRLGHWPVGYDLVRLAMQLRIRLLGMEDGSDWIHNDLDGWCKEPLFSLSDSQSDVLCFLARLCESGLQQYIKDLNNDEVRSINSGLLLCALYDAIKMVSYADLSPFKRLWVAINCHTFIRELRATSNASVR